MKSVYVLCEFKSSLSILKKFVENCETVLRVCSLQVPLFSSLLIRHLSKSIENLKKEKEISSKIKFLIQNIQNKKILNENEENFTEKNSNLIEDQEENFIDNEDLEELDNLGVDSSLINEKVSLFPFSFKKRKK